MGSHQLFSRPGTSGSRIWYERVAAKSIRTVAMGVAIDPNMGLGSLYVMAKKRQIIIQEKNDSASNAVPSGTNPEKIARCNSESE